MHAKFQPRCNLLIKSSTHTCSFAAHLQVSSLPEDVVMVPTSTSYLLQAAGTEQQREAVKECMLCTHYVVHVMPRSLDPVCQDLKSAIKKLDKVWKMTRKVQPAIVIGVKLCVVTACSQQSLFQVVAM